MAERGSVDRAKESERPGWRSRRGRAAAVAVAALAVAVFTTARAAQDGVAPGTAAPELVPAPWINSAPLTLAGLRGKVVLVDFWTYG